MGTSDYKEAAVMQAQQTTLTQKGHMHFEGEPCATATSKHFTTINVFPFAASSHMP
jgi:hypothetical protein